MAEMGRMLMWIGAMLFVIGLIFAFAGRIPGLGHLPGDIVYRRGNFTLYAPLGTMILLSILLTVVLNLVARWMR
ncbi:DUF2905 domain-containing protein [Litorilinea aerophila]|uniref:DUF2905 domain-containing protein n=1 Tax=Litorilinea aerophila TaxID=1204385 RepID=A0A540VFX7_9CHLR|nr:DUF2905 domain-containing protein [Litorilinea aerophila]MCC9076669.1 DUF2905 domain-containing protein [Litorilinea aerophila]OUC05566.1 hypothetical protein RY27_26485 [Litorilinea aerophila]GIV77707.1 MAG: hypothetical protein KatS3mg050_2101 [Litorilinea sp.]